MKSLVSTTQLALCVWLMLASPHAFAALLDFQPGASGEFKFNTGVLAGTLRPQGKALGIVSVVHQPTGLAVDRGDYGLCSVYRVFTTNHRYGKAAWDWPSTATLAQGGVRVHWATETNRPFALETLYCWTAPNTLRVTVTVHALKDLSGFEVFLASYFNAAFTNAMVLVPSLNGQASKFTAAGKTDGLWQMFPRDSHAIELIQDGRWAWPPSPVEWTMRPFFTEPTAVRRAGASGLTATFHATRQDCFAVAMPYQEERHYSLYLSLFGRDIQAGRSESAIVTLEISKALSAMAQPKP